MVSAFLEPTVKCEKKVAEMHCYHQRKPSIYNSTVMYSSITNAKNSPSLMLESHIVSEFYSGFI